MCMWGRDRKAHGNIVASGKWVGGMVTISAFLFGLYLFRLSCNENYFYNTKIIKGNITGERGSTLLKEEL